MSWIQTYTGRKFDVLNPRVEDVDLRDIARALSMQCRYVGHVDRFYSVAEHSVRVAAAALSLFDDIPAIPRWALMHDAAEAYLGDVSRPLKRLPEMQGYRDAEKRMMAIIAERFGLEGEEPEIVRDLDSGILRPEVLALKYPPHPDWFTTAPTGSWTPEKMSDLGWSPKRAEREFLKAHKELFT
jgi:hypothetical protein